MIRDITLGQYYPGNSCIHRLDARVKIIGVIVYIVSLFIIDNFFGFIIAFVSLALVVRASRVPLKFILRGLKPVFLIILLTVILNLFMVKGDILVSFGIFHITKQGIRTAVFLCIRLLFLIIGSSLLTLATRPIELTDGIEKLLSPFRKIGLPAHEIAMMMTIALRFIPTLLEETDKIMKAQQARGADFESGNIFKRVRALMPVLVPLFISAFRIASDLAMAMEARCYRGDEGRTRMKAMRLRKGDAAAAALLALYLAAVITEAVLI